MLERDRYRDQIVTRLHHVMWVCFCFPRHIHGSCSTVMALLYLPVSELVSCTFSTIPTCPFFYLLPANCMLISYMYICDQHQQLYHPVQKYTISWNCWGNKDAGPITLQPLYCIVALDYSLTIGWAMVPLLVLVV